MILNKPRLFVDMDGTIAEWRTAAKYEDLLEENYFGTLRPYKNVVDAINIIVDTGRVEVFSLSAILAENPFAISEKKEWIDVKGLKIREENRLFTVGKTPKKDAVPEGIRDTDILLDDFTKNLNAWAEHAIAIKLMNGVNGTNGTWMGPSISRFNKPEDIANYILSFA